MTDRRGVFKHRHASQSLDDMQVLDPLMFLRGRIKDVQIL